MNEYELEEIQDLGEVSKLTQGRTSGIWPEASIIPWRICNPPGTPSCPGA